MVLRHWLLNYFVHDFIPCRELRVYLTSFLNELPYHRLIRNSPRDQRIVKSLKRVVRRLKKVYYVSSSASERVKVIPPPPPTEDQERIEEMVRAKLAQSSIRRKTALVSSMNVSDRHHGNMAVQDTRLAPVVVVGSVRTTKGGSSGRGISGAASPMDMSRASPTTGVRRNMSSTSIPRFRRRDQRQEIEAVKSSYMKRMEQQRRAMSVDLNTTSSSLKEAPPTPIPQEEDEEEQPQQQTRVLESSRSSVLTDDSLESALSPGTTDVEMSSDDDDDDEEETSDEDEDEDDKQLVEKLETERERREKEEEMNRAEFFASTRATSEPSSPTPDSPTLRERKLLHRSQHIVNSLPPMPNQEDATDQQMQLQEVESTVESDAASKSRRSVSVAAESKSLPDRVARPSLASLNDDAKMSSISHPDMPHQQPTSTTSPTRIVELDLPKPHIPSSLPPSESPSRRTSAVYPKSFILYYRSERMAKQLCLIEAQALLGIDWEEMVHCRWTKMPATSTGMGDEYSEYTDDLDDPDINYTRRTRQMQLARREHEGGIEQVIKRFNDVCQWVASEIVHTRALDERVKVVEKFIRLAQVCLFFMNLYTQCLLETK